MAHNRHSAMREDKGVAAVEFAIILPLFILLLAGIIDFGRILYAHILVSNAAREGVRMVAMGYADLAGERVEAALPNVAFVGEIGAATVVGCPASPGPMDAAQYTVRLDDVDWLLIDAFVPGLGPPTVQATATMRCNG